MGSRLASEARYGGGGDVLVASGVLSASDESLTLTGLDGDAHEIYMVEGLILGKLSTTQSIRLGINSDYSNHRFSRSNDGGAGTQAGGCDFVDTNSASTTRQEYRFSGIISAARTLYGVTSYRSLAMRVVHNYNAFNQLSTAEIAIGYQTSTANMDSLALNTVVTDGLLAGTYMKVWRRG